MKFLSTMTLAALLLLLHACQSGPQNQDAMARFVKDQSFVAAHEAPQALKYAAQGQTITFTTPDGKSASAYAVMANPSSKKYLLVIHEWWGLNDHIKQEADRLAASLPGVNVLALDMYDGKVATTPADAGKFMNAMSPERGAAIIKGALAYGGKKAQFATVGWCFGGGWSLRSSILAGKQAAGCVMYYGMPVENAADLAPLKAEVLGIFATKDGWITPAVAQKFQDLAAATGKKVTIQQFEADHAFANPSNPKYDKAAAEQANALALAFLKKKLKA